MDFIKIEQFKSLDEEIQKTLLKLWKPKRYDLYIDSNDLSQVECLDYIKESDEGILYSSMRDNTSFLEDMVPLLMETRIIQLIQEKTGFKIELLLDGFGQYYACLYKNLYSVIPQYTFDKLGDNILQAYWKILIKVVKGDIVDAD